MVTLSVSCCAGVTGISMFDNAEDRVRRVSGIVRRLGCKLELTVYAGTAGSEVGSDSRSSSLNSYGENVSISGKSDKICFLISIVVLLIDELQCVYCPKWPCSRYASSV